MESLNKKESFSGNQKVKEYIDRIKNGEDKEVIISGLPPSFVDAIEKGLISVGNNSKEEDGNIKNIVVPPQYRGFNSELLEEIWTIPEYIDPEKTNQEKIKKQKVIEYLKGKEIENTKIEDRISNDTKKIDEIKKELGLEKEENNIERHSIVLPNLEDIIKNGGGQLEVFSDGKKIDFSDFAVSVDGDYAEVLFVRKKDQDKNKGVGLSVYIELGKRLSEKGITLYSSKAQYGPGNNLWHKISKLGLAERLNGGFKFINKEILENKDLKEGDDVKYLGRSWKIIEVIKHKYDIGDFKKESQLYSLERDDGYILQEGGVKKFVSVEDLE